MPHRRDAKAPKRDPAAVHGFVAAFLWLRAALRDREKRLAIIDDDAPINRLMDMIPQGRRPKARNLLERRYPYLIFGQCRCRRETIQVMQHYDRDSLNATHLCTTCVAANNVRECTQCHYGTHRAREAGGEVYCTSCWRRRPFCERCERRDQELVDAGAGHLFCYSCLALLPVCPRCGERYWGARCRTPECRNCQCEAPHKEFDFPIDAGRSSLRSDRPHEVTLPSGIIAEEGLVAIIVLIARLLTEVGWDIPNRRARNLVDEVGNQWMKSTGSFPKRLAKAVYKYYGKGANLWGVKPIELSDETLADVGNIAKQHTIKEARHVIEFTRNLNLSAADFAHPESCYWGGSKHSRCALKGSGGLGVRTFDEKCRATGRAWILPMDDTLMPMLDATKASAYFVFNGYGEMSGYAPAQLVAMLTGLTYRKVPVHSPHDIMYVNGETGFLVATQEILAPFAADKGKRLDLTMLQNVHGVLPEPLHPPTKLVQRPLDVGALNAQLGADIHGQDQHRVAIERIILDQLHIGPPERGVDWRFRNPPVVQGVGIQPEWAIRDPEPLFAGEDDFEF